MKLVHQKILFLASAYSLAHANARHFGVVSSSGLASTTRRTATYNHYHDHNDAIIAPAMMVMRLRGGGSSGIEENPEYVSDEDSSSSDDDDDELHESDSDDDDVTTLKSVSKRHRNRHPYYPKVLLVSKSNKEASSNTKNNKKRSSYNKRIRKIMKKDNRLNFYILLAIIAFRKEIGEFVFQIIPTTLDPDTGKRKIAIRWSTDVLKLILVGVVIHRFVVSSSATITFGNNNDVEDGNDDNDIESTTEHSPSSKKRPRLTILPLILLGLLLHFFPTVGRQIGMLLPFLLPMIIQSLSGESDPDSPLSRLFLMMGSRGDSSDLATRMAYLPSLEQHYTFEQLNERYYRDWGAWNKAFPTNPMVAASAATSAMGGAAARGSGDGMISLLSSLCNARGSSLPSSSSRMANDARNTMNYPTKYNNGTVIVLDMTNLDMKASKMDSIRDQISFLIQLVQTELAPSNVSTQADTGDLQQSNVNATIDETNLAANGSSTNNATETSLESNSSQQSSLSLPPSAQSPTVEVIVLLESPGGGVSQYGLAASHLQRLRSTPNILLTVCIDEMAASGGYMMACMSSPNQLYCAPFAMVGSIGVIGQALNVQKTLEKYGVQPYVFRGGKMKNPVGMVGEVTKAGLATMQESVERIHDAFRGHVAGARGEAFTEAAMLLRESERGAVSKGKTGNYFQLGSGETVASTPTTTTTAAAFMDKVATGDVFLGTQALELGLVDRLITSDEYIAERIRQGARVLKLIQYHRRPPGLSGLFLPPSHPHSSMQQPSLIGLAKRVVFRMTASLLTWAEDGLATGGTASAPTFSATAGGGGVVDDFQP